MKKYNWIFVFVFLFAIVGIQRAQAVDTDYQVLLNCFNKSASDPSCAKANFDGLGIVIGSPDIAMFKAAFKYDLNGDGIIDFSSASADYAAFIGCYNQTITSTSTEICKKADFNSDGFIGGPDYGLFLLAKNFDLNGDGKVDLNTSVTTSPINADLKAAGLDTEVFVSEGGSVMLSWTSIGAISCELTKNEVGPIYSNAPIAGSYVYAPNYGSASEVIVRLNCKNAQGNIVSDSVTIKKLNSPSAPSLTVTSVVPTFKGQLVNVQFSNLPVGWNVRIIGVSGAAQGLPLTSTTLLPLPGNYTGNSVADYTVASGATFTAITVPTSAPAGSYVIEVSDPLGGWATKIRTPAFAVAATTTSGGCPGWAMPPPICFDGQILTTPIDSNGCPGPQMCVNRTEAATTTQMCPYWAPVICFNGQIAIAGPIYSNGCRGPQMCVNRTETATTTQTTTTNPDIASLMKMIEELKKQIAILQGQVVTDNSLPNETTSFSYNWQNALYVGMKNNEDVKALQNALLLEKVYTGPVTGNFGPMTLAATRAFQEKYGITPVTGFVGDLTRNKLNSLY